MSGVASVVQLDSSMRTVSAMDASRVVKDTENSELAPLH
jgi:hypothetical protein